MVKSNNLFHTDLVMSLVIDDKIIQDTARRDYVIINTSKITLENKHLTQNTILYFLLMIQCDRMSLIPDRVIISLSLVICTLVNNNDFNPGAYT